MPKQQTQLIEWIEEAVYQGGTQGENEQYTMFKELYESILNSESNRLLADLMDAYEQNAPDYYRSEVIANINRYFKNLEDTHDLIKETYPDLAELNI